MKKFVFKLQKLLEVRQYEQRQAEAELGKANAEVSRIQGELDTIAKNRVSSIKNNGSAQDLYVQSQLSNYLYMLDQKKEVLLEDLVQAQMISDQKREVVRECLKNTKSLEKLREKQLSEWKKEMIREEENIVDDVVSAKGNNIGSR